MTTDDEIEDTRKMKALEDDNERLRAALEEIASMPRTPSDELASAINIASAALDSTKPIFKDEAEAVAEVSRVAKIMGRQTIGGRVIVPASNLDFSKTYSFRADGDGKTYFWSGIAPERDGEHAIFELPPQEISKTANVSGAVTGAVDDKADTK